MKHIITPAILIWTVLLSGPVDAQNLIGKQKDIDQILKNIELFSGYYMNAEYENIAASYTADGKIFPSRAGIIEGHEAIRKRWTLPEGAVVLHHKINPVEIKIIKKYAYDFGYYEGETQRANGEKVSFRGKYVIVWRKEKKDWKIYLDIWNRIDN